MTDLQKRRIKELVDEMIVNQGCVTTKNPDDNVDGIREDTLVKIAFRYYKMVYSGENVISPEGTLEWYRCANCPDKCTDYNDLAKSSLNPDRKFSLRGQIPQRCPKGEDYMPPLSCANCGLKYNEITEGKIELIPLCNDCRSKIGTDVEIMNWLIS
ncbi:MAG TPA: hypothetical protein EYP53_09285 [Candidatus Latescibacteria bacterium]|nr:hypothetical protein [Candidatus Latescibacterota bacterium]